MPDWQKDSNLHVKLVSVFGKAVQNLEDTLSGLLDKRAISTASGLQLDNIGTILNQPRNGLQDSFYRPVLIGAAALVGNQSGTMESLISLATNVLGGIYGFLGVVCDEFFPAMAVLNVEVVQDPGSGVSDQAIYGVIEASAVAGVFVAVVLYLPTGFLYGDSVGVNQDGDLPLGSLGYSDVSLADSNGDIPMDSGGGNYGRLL